MIPTKRRETHAILMRFSKTAANSVERIKLLQDDT